MIQLQTYRDNYLPGLTDIWNQTFVGQPNFVRVAQADLLCRVVRQPSFEPANLTVAAEEDHVRGFVHFGPRSNFWHDPSGLRADPTEGQIYAVVAPETDRSLVCDLIAFAVDQLTAAGARRILLGPSWVYGAQPFYNGIAGAYEFPGLSAARHTLVDLAADAGFERLAEYDTPEIDFADRAQLDHLQAVGEELRPRQRELGLQLSVRPLVSTFLSRRECVDLVRGAETVATAAYGLWEEYSREYSKRLFGITSVQVAPRWRGKGLGKLAVLRAIEAAIQAGAAGVHLHVWRDNKVAWNLYHRALGFTSRFTWFTLVKLSARHAPAL